MRPTQDTAMNSRTRTNGTISGSAADNRSSRIAQHLLRARQSEAAGRLQEAIAAYRIALQTAHAADATLTSARQRLALLLVRTDRLTEAVALFAPAPGNGTGTGTGTEDGGWLQEEVTAALAQRHFGFAGDCARLAAALRWGEPVPAGRAATPTHSFPVTAAKLRHDADQFDFLDRQRLLPPAYAGLAARYRSIADAFDRQAPDLRVPLESESMRILWPTYNRLLHLRPMPRVPFALSGSWDRRTVEATYLEGQLGIAVVDDFLTEDALKELRQFCLESTVWFANRYGHGRLGAFFQDGFNCPLLLQIAEELRDALPNVIGDRYPLRQIWGFKNAPTLPPDCTTHADFAAVNVNFWLTPDEANLDPATGGMVIFDVDAPLQWDFETYNGNAHAIRQFLTGQGARHAVIPYRQNRAIIFHSDLFHGTCEVRFRPEYENRRLNVTFLYGDREHEMDHPLARRSGLPGYNRSTAWRSRVFTRLRR